MSVRAILESLRDTANARVFLAATGAGAGIQRALWEVPGISKLLVGAAFPYAADETARFLGFTPERYCCEEASVDLATAAFMLAAREDGSTAVGIGLTASVASRAAHKGEHRAHVAFVTDEGTGTAQITLPKDAGEEARVRDGERTDALGLEALCTALGRGTGAHSFRGVDDVVRTRLFARPYFRADGTRAVLDALPERAAIFPGAFNPPHEGHLGAADAVRAAGRPVVFSTTVDPPHKPRLTTAEVLRRAALLRGQDVIFTEGDPLYLEKARRFPGRAFVVGADAFVRMLDPKWGPSVPALVTELRDLGAHFYVIPRLVEGRFTTLEHIRAMDPYREAVSTLHVHAVEGRWDVSSSEIRAARG